MRLPRVQRQRYKGAVRYWLHRMTGARLPDPPNGDESDPAFVAAWLAEEAKGKPKPQIRQREGSVGWAIRRYIASPTHRAGSPAYRRMIERNLQDIEGRAGTGMLDTLTSTGVRNDLSKLSGSVAVSRHKAWRKLYAWLHEAGIVPEDITLTIRRPKVAATDGHAPWSRDDVAAFRSSHAIGTTARAGMELLHWTGARTADAGGLTWAQVSGGLLTYRQTKTGGMAHVPWAPLPAWAAPIAGDFDIMLAALAGAGLPDALLLFPTRTGGRRSAKGLSNLVNSAARDAGLVRRTAHGLRKTRLIALAELGLSTHRIAGWGGHASLAEVEHYTREASRRAVMRG